MKKILASIILCLGSFFILSGQTVGIKVVSNGNVGIGTSSPVEKLEVSGGIKLGNTTSANAGTIRWNGNCFEGYNGSSWIALSAGCGGAGPTCSDGIQNQGETGIDCGGPCTPCSSGPSCSDGIQNQGETGIDCGGPCAPCSSGGCNDIANIDATRPLANLWFNNEYNVGGTPISGDGELYFTIDAISGNSQQYIALNYDPNTDASYSGLDYGIYFYPNTALNRYWYIVKENGSNASAWTFPTSSIVGSTFSIERSGTTITYKKDGVVFHTSAVASSGDLYFDNSFYYPNSGTDVFKLKDISLCPPGVSPATSGSSASIIQTEIDPSTTEKYGIELSNIDESYLSLPSPNPFSDRAQVSFSIGKDYYEAELVFSDSYGRELGRQEIQSENGILEIESTNLKSGIYQYSLVIDGEIVKTNKMVVVK